ncbi:MAG: PhoH family protein, partial [Bacteroidetes bacterium]|nr:PhoH family protein [Bacteroidota bacterium]
MTTKRRSRKESETSKQQPKRVEAKTPKQKDYIRSIIENDIIFCTGPSGCGKSF